MAEHGGPRGRWDEKDSVGGCQNVGEGRNNAQGTAEQDSVVLCSKLVVRSSTHALCLRGF